MPDSTLYTSKLKDKKILIFGGTAGIGLAVAAASLESGANVVLCSSRDSSIEKAKKTLSTEYPSASHRLEAITCNLFDPDLDNALAGIFNTIGKLDHIVYTAGDNLELTPFETVTLPQITKAHHLRSFIPLLLAKHAAKALHHGPESSLTLTTGSIAHKPIPGGWSVTAAVGAGICGLTRQLAFEMRPVRVNCVAPGVVDTPLWDHGMDEEEKRAFLEACKEKTATGEVGRPSDVAEAYLFLMKDRNCTGTVVNSDGGALLL